MAVNPAGAILNYLYALLEAEARLACQVVGLDPRSRSSTPTPGRDSLPLDLMEAARPSVDRYLSAFLRDPASRFERFFVERLRQLPDLTAVTHELAETLPSLAAADRSRRRAVSPPAPSRVIRGSSRLPTPLTQGEPSSRPGSAPRWWP